MEANYGQAKPSAPATNANMGAAFAVGMIVQVEARTWPGINKPGGVGRITHIHHSEEEVISVDVRYTVVGGRERRVPIQHVQLAPEFDAAHNGDSAIMHSQPRNMRDRSGLLGRCTRCGSLRADCGSCDWIEEEQTRNQPEQQTNVNSQQQRRKKASHGIRKIQVSLEEESLSSSSEDEEQIKADNKRRRRYRRQRANWMRVMNDDFATDDSDESSDNDDDPMMARLVELERRRREEKKQRLARKYSVSTKKKRRRRPRTIGLSTLEALDKPPPSRRTSLNAHNSNHSSPASSPRPNIINTEARPPAEVDNVGDADISSQDSLPPHADDNEMEQASTTVKDSRDYSPMADVSMEDLEGLGFIQPEGEAAAEHLPSGIVDQTRSVPYKELPAFFDNLMNDISNEHIPDANVDLACFQRKVRDAREANDTASLNRLKEEGAQLYRVIQQRVIRDGMDQCQQAMRRMTSSRERRRHKEGMSRMELRDFRGTALEARDVRYDLVAKEAERLLRDATDALLDSFCDDDEMEVEDNESCYSSEVSNELLDSSLIRDSFAASGAARTGDDLSLPPFDPHMHASTVRGYIAPRNRSRQTDVSNRSARRKLPKKSSESSTRDDTRMPKTRSGGQAPRVDRSRQESDDSDSGYKTFCGDSISFEVIDGNTMQPRKRRKAAKSQSRQREEEIKIFEASDVNEKRPNQVSARDRMEAFTRANSLDVDDSNMSDESQEEPVESRRQRCRDQFSGRREPSSGATPTIDEEVSVLADKDYVHPSQAKHSMTLRSNISTEAFYRRVERKRAPSTMDEPRHHHASLSESCKALLSKYRDSVDGCVAIFDDILNYFKVVVPVVHSDAVETFATLLQLLQEHGTITLMEAALYGTRRFKRHVQLMVFALRLLDCKVNCVLTVADGIAFKLFGRESWKDFVEMLVLQLMDVVYARVQPAGWGLDNMALSGLFENLVPLRDAIGSVVPLVETISRCMLEKFQCQKWCEVDGNSDSLFISALDPQDFRSLILTGTSLKLTPASDSLRFSSFKKVIPRCEIETIWVLLGFSAERPTEQTTVSKYRWRLLTALFIGTAGVLSKEYFDASSINDKTKPFPGKDQITQCRAEMSRLCVLLSSSALNPLPDSDSFLTKLVQKCLLLQVHEYLYCFDEHGEKSVGFYDAVDRNRLSRTWKASHLLGQNTSEGVFSRDTNIPREGCVDHTLGRMTSLQPISALLESCVKLSMAWIRQTPRKKARRSRLTQSLHNLVKDCIDCASKLEVSNEEGDKNTVIAASTFEEAFAVQNTNAGPLCAASAYREVAARLSVIAAIGGYHETSASITSNLRETAWATMADSIMKRRQQLIVAGRIFAEEETYNGDVIRLFSTARTIAWFTNILWLAEKGITTDQTSLEIAEIELDDDRNMLLFLSSCLSSCLVCVCDAMKPQDNLAVLHRNAVVSAEFENAVMSSICLWLSELCIHSREILNASMPEAETSALRLKEAAQELRSKILTILTPAIKSCLLRLTNLTIYSENANLALLSVLSLTRAAVSLEATKVLSNDSDIPQAPLSATQSTDDDLFGSMDDSLFVNIDLNAIGYHAHKDNPSRGQNQGDGDAREFKDLWTILVDMIKSSKPSDHFAILPSTMARATNEACRTVPGRTMVAKNIGEIAACLATLTSLDKLDDQTVNSSLDHITRPVKSLGWRAREDSDQSYFRATAQCFFSELCSLSGEYKQCDRIVRQRWDNIIEHFVDSMLDSNTLERFPSMNLKRIKENGGKRSERKQSLRLKLANAVQQSNSIRRDSVNIVGARLGRDEKESCPGPAYNSSHLWSFCKSLGKAVARHGEPCSGALNESSGLGKLFCELDSDLVDRPRDAIPLVSLERECIQRFMFFRGMLTYSSKQSIEGVLSFQSLSNLIISCCCYQLVSISKGVHYQARHGRMKANDGTISYKHSRLLELQSCYTELTFALLCWILRECPTGISATFGATLQYVRDQLFSQILLKRSSDLYSSLERLYYIATTGAVANGVAARTTEKDESGVLNDTFVAIVRRSREVMLHLALDQRQNGMSNVYCLFNSFISLATNCTANEEWMFQLIEKSMGGDAGLGSPITTPSTNSSPFQRALDEYMNHAAFSCTAADEEQTALHQLRCVAIRKFLVPKLLKADVPLFQKKNMLRLLSYILQVENIKRLAPQEGFEIQLIANMAKAIASCIRSALESPSVDDQLVSCGFQCSKSILALPYNTESIIGDEEETILIWSHRCKDETTKPPYALYLWTFASWMNHVGAMLIANHDTRRLQDFRSKAVSITTQGQSIWNDKDTRNVVLQESSRLLSLEAKVFVEKENARPVMNVYAKSRSKPQPSLALSEHVEWAPSSTVRKAVKELQAKVISVL